MYIQLEGFHKLAVAKTGKEGIFGHTFVTLTAVRVTGYHIDSLTDHENAN
jgi:hypothetical protein